MARIDPDRLAAALEWAHARYHQCDVCALRCGVDRHAGELGTCELGVDARVYKEYLHLGEERSLLPSHTVFVTGCSFRCAFCSDWAQVTRPNAHGTPLSPAAMAARIARRRAQGARNVNFVGGVPDVNLLWILEVLQHVPGDTHVVWNTNLWTTEEVVERLTGVVGTWLADHKFGNDTCGKKLARVEGYLGVLEPRLEQIAATGADVIVRHLVMPGHLDCCTAPVLAWMADRLPRVPVNLMLGYQPFSLARSASPLGGRLSEAERARALAMLEASGVHHPLVDGVEYEPAR